MIGTTALTFFAAFRAGEFWARAMAAGLALVAFAGLAAVMIARHDAAVLEKAETARAIEGFKRTGVSDQNVVAFQRLSQRNQCLVLSHQSGLPDSTCDGMTP
jgi:Kef-type K+ transport system membrane component KefB